MKSRFRNRIAAIWRKIRPSTTRSANDRWLDARKERVLASLRDPISPLNGRPYIRGGTYNWNVEGLVDLDFFFPNFPIAVKVAPRTHGPYSGVMTFTVSRSLWEVACADDAFVIDVCNRAGIPLLFVGPDDPIDPYSITIALRALLPK